jgi:acyl dehydratase
VGPVRYFEDIAVGETFRTPGRTVTEADVVCFAGISGDHEALDFSRRPPGRTPTVPDPLVITITSGLGFRVSMPQPQVLAFMVLDWRFLAPVRVGDTVHCRMEVTAKRAMREGGVVVEKRVIVNQDGEVVQEGEYKLLVARRPREGRGATE